MNDNQQMLRRIEVLRDARTQVEDVFSRYSEDELTQLAEDVDAQRLLRVSAPADWQRMRDKLAVYAISLELMRRAYEAASPATEV